MQDAVTYFLEVVEPTLAEFEQNPKSRRHCFLAFVTIFHTVDYLAYPKKPQTIRRAFYKASSDFAISDRVVVSQFEFSRSFHSDLSYR
jgi:hypothetical protein